MLINCKECNKEYSDKAEACPNCGCPTVEVQVQQIDPLDYVPQDTTTARSLTILARIIRHLPNMKWYLRYLFYLVFGGGLFVFFTIIFAMTVEQSFWNDIYNSQHTFTIFLLIIVASVLIPIEYKTLKSIKRLKAESKENGQK